MKICYLILGLMLGWSISVSAASYDFSRVLESLLPIKHGDKFDATVDGRQVTVTYVGIEPIKDHRYAVLLDVY